MEIRFNLVAVPRNDGKPGDRIRVDYRLEPATYEGWSVMGSADTIEEAAQLCRKEIVGFAVQQLDTVPLGSHR